MLVLSRMTDERINIGKDIVLTVVAIKGNRVVLGIEAPPTTKIMRDELDPRDTNSLTEPPTM